MEMPKGWKRVHAAPDTRGADGVYRVELTIGDRAHVVSLVKEMAEALESLINSGFREDQKLQAKFALKTLKKFKEWE